jgi:hypothetical protein
MTTKPEPEIVLGFGMKTFVAGDLSHTSKRMPFSSSTGGTFWLRNTTDLETSSIVPDQATEL